MATTLPSTQKGHFHRLRKATPMLSRSIPLSLHIIFFLFFLFFFIFHTPSLPTPSFSNQSQHFSGDLRDITFSWNNLPFAFSKPPPVSLKIAVFTRKWPSVSAPGGMERHALTLHSALAARGHRVHVFTSPPPPSDTTSLLVTSDIPCFPVPLSLPLSASLPLSPSSSPYVTPPLRFLFSFRDSTPPSPLSSSSSPSPTAAPLPLLSQPPLRRDRSSYHLRSTDGSLFLSSFDLHTCPPTLVSSRPPLLTSPRDVCLLSSPERSPLLYSAMSISSPLLFPPPKV